MAADTTQNKTKFFDKIGHWVTAYMMSDPEFMQAERADFNSSAFAELYIEGSIVKDVWMFNMLNRITEMRHEQKQTPHILIKILLKPENEALSLYSVNLNVTASQNLPINLATIASQAVSKHLNKTPYSEPAYAVDDIEKALEEIFQNLKTALGNSLAPNLLLRYNNEIYWSGHEITVLANEGNSVEIEALDKNLQPIPSAQLSWTNASPYTHKGVVDLTNLSSQQVSVRRQQQGSQPDNATVTLKRVNVTEDINDLLKALIIEVLSAKKEEVQDTLNTLLQNRTENAEKIKQYIANLERYNFPMEGPASGSLMFPTPLYRADSAALMNTDNEQTRNIATSILALKKQKAIKRKIKVKANVAAFADLVVDNPERLEDLLDELLRNSGSLIAQLILNRDNSGTRQTARNIVVDFINRNIERIAGSAAMATPAETEPIIEIPVLPSAAPAFNPTRRLYLSASLPANTSQELESALRDYLNNLEEPLYVFVNYSHEGSFSAYLNRAEGNRPVGIPADANFMVYTIVHVPGSIQENIVSSADPSGATNTVNAIFSGVQSVSGNGSYLSDNLVTDQKSSVVSTAWFPFDKGTRYVKLGFLKEGFQAKGNTIIYNDVTYNLMYSAVFKGFYNESQLKLLRSTEENNVKSYANRDLLGVSKLQLDVDYVVLEQGLLASHTVRWISYLEKRGDLSKEQFDRLLKAINTITDEAFSEALQSNPRSADGLLPCGGGS